MIVETVYRCGVCRKPFSRRADALVCENKGVEKAVADVGDIVFATCGFGWFDGDKAWVSNPQVRRFAHYTPHPVRKPCPRGDRNCFAECCCYKFFYVVTAIDLDDQDDHRIRYHLFTLAMTGKNGHANGYTFNEGHFTPEKVAKPPVAVLKASKKLIGKKSRRLL